MISIKLNLATLNYFRATKNMLYYCGLSVRWAEYYGSKYHRVSLQWKGSGYRGTRGLSLLLILAVVAPTGVQGTQGLLLEYYYCYSYEVAVVAPTVVTASETIHVSAPIYSSVETQSSWNREVKQCISNDKCCLRLKCCSQTIINQCNLGTNYLYKLINRSFLF